MQNVSCSRQALHLALLGIAVGVCAGAISIAFRRTIELCHTLTLPSAGFAAADSTLRFALPVLGTAVAVCVLPKMAIDTVHPFFEMDVVQMNCFPESLGIIR